MTFGEWFVQVALSGILATSVAAGVAAWLAVRGVRKTIAEERAAAAEALFVADCRSVIDKADAMRRMLMAGVQDDLQTTVQVWDLNLALHHLERRALGRQEDKLADLAGAMRNWPPPNTQFLVCLLPSISELLSWRISIPDYFATMEAARCRHQACAGEGAVIHLGVPAAAPAAVSKTSRWRRQRSRRRSKTG